MFPGDKAISILGIFTSNTEKLSAPDRLAVGTKCLNVSDQASLGEISFGGVVGGESVEKGQMLFHMYEQTDGGESKRAVNSKGNQGGLIAAVIIAVRPQMSPSSQPYCQKAE